jgi:hypothetical protein
LIPSQTPTLYGLDFTSAPRRGKPITVARCRLEGTCLVWEGFEDLLDFEAFEGLLERPGPWVAAMDFPFGQPRKLIENLGWPAAWEGYVETVAALGSKARFREVLKAYRDPRPPGDKQHPREIDARSRSQSPMTVYGTPVGLMFFEGAPRLARSRCRVLPMRPGGDRERTVLEGYPALVARTLIGRSSYKTESRSQDTAARRAARRVLVEGLASAPLAERYGITVALPPAVQAQLRQEHQGDRLDALLCAIQAAWASRRRDLGVPAAADGLEGWIADPVLVG